MSELAVMILAAVGSLFIAIAAIGLLRMPDVYSRLHAASKAATLGSVSLALALVMHFAEPGVVFRASALALVLFVTAPLSAHLIGRAAFVSRVPAGEPYEHDESAGWRRDQLGLPVG